MPKNQILYLFSMKSTSNSEGSLNRNRSEIHFDAQII